ncbi:MAG: hypothetical protein J6P44_03595 [Bacteroidales bacterium]|nr:hypothetical protein [Bacteroidales bacterium]
MEENKDFQSKIPDIPQENKDVIELTPTLREDLTVSVKWSKFLAVAGIVVSVLTLIAAIAMFVGSPASADEEDVINPITMLAGVGTGIAYLIMAVIYGGISIILLKTANNLKVALSTGEQDKFSAGFHYLKTFVTIMGIMTVIGLAIALFSIIGICLI